MNHFTVDKSKFRGMLTALLTPYDKNGNISKASLEKLMNFSLNCGIKGFYVGGSTGEGVLLSTEERKHLFRLAAEINAGRGTLIGHVGSTSTEEAIELALCCKEQKYDAISAVAPFYYGHSFEAIKGFYNDIAEASGMPVVIYNFPLSGSFSLTKDALHELMKNPQIFAIKHTSQDLFALQQFKTMEEAPVVFNGYDEMLAAGLIMGADGGIGSTYNFMPHKIVKAYNLFREEKVKEAMALQNEINEIISTMLAASKRSGVFNTEKAILEEMGIEMGQAKKPFLPISGEDRALIRPMAKKLLEEVKDLI